MLAYCAGVVAVKAEQLERAQRVGALAVHAFGAEPQLRQVQEEAGELVAAVNRYTRGRDPEAENLLEEAGQVFAMLMQVRVILGAERFDQAVDAALDKSENIIGRKLGQMVIEAEP